MTLESLNEVIPDEIEIAEEEEEEEEEQQQLQQEFDIDDFLESSAAPQGISFLSQCSIRYFLFSLT